MSNPVVIVAAAGTGGHIFPGLALVEALEQCHLRVVWVGTATGMENRIIDKSRFTFEAIPFSGVRGKGWRRYIRLPWDLLAAIIAARGIIKKHQAKMVVGMGGYITAPMGIAAFSLGCPLVIHEQNARAGTANRWLSKIARLRFCAFEKALTHAKIVGNPVRKELQHLPIPKERYAQHADGSPLNLLIIGGSQGASFFNQVLPLALAQLALDQRPRVLHQTGEKHLTQTQNQYQQLGVEAQCQAFVQDMREAYLQADLVICRAGASTIAELMVVGVAGLIVPLPHSIDDHQTLNALYLTDLGAAMMMRQEHMTPSALAQKLRELNRAQLLKLAQAAKDLAPQDPAQMMAQSCLQMIKDIGEV